MQPAISRTLGRELQRSACSACALISAPVAESCACSAGARSYSSKGQLGDGSSSASSGSHRADGAAGNRTDASTCTTAASGHRPQVQHHFSPAQLNVSPAHSATPCAVSAASSSTSSSSSKGVCGGSGSSPSSLHQQRNLHLSQQQQQAAYAQAATRSDDEADTVLQHVSRRPHAGHTAAHLDDIFPTSRRSSSANSPHAHNTFAMGEATAAAASCGTAAAVAAAAVGPGASWQALAQQLAHNKQGRGASSSSSSSEAGSMPLPQPQGPHGQQQQRQQQQEQAMEHVDASNSATLAPSWGPVQAAAVNAELLALQQRLQAQHNARTSSSSSSSNAATGVGMPSPAPRRPQPEQQQQQQQAAEVAAAEGQGAPSTLSAAGKAGNAGASPAEAAANPALLALRQQLQAQQSARKSGSNSSSMAGFVMKSRSSSSPPAGANVGPPPAAAAAAATTEPSFDEAASYILRELQAMQSQQAGNRAQDLQRRLLNHQQQQQQQDAPVGVSAYPVVEGAAPRRMPAHAQQQQQQPRPPLSTPQLMEMQQAFEQQQQQQQQHGPAAADAASGLDALRNTLLAPGRKQTQAAAVPSRSQDLRRPKQQHQQQQLRQELEWLQQREQQKQQQRQQQVVALAQQLTIFIQQQQLQTPLPQQGQQQQQQQAVSFQTILDQFVGPDSAGQSVLDQPPEQAAAAAVQQGQGAKQKSVSNRKQQQQQQGLGLKSRESLVLMEYLRSTLQQQQQMGVGADLVAESTEVSAAALDSLANFLRSLPGRTRKEAVSSSSAISVTAPAADAFETVSSSSEGSVTASAVDSAAAEGSAEGGQAEELLLQERPVQQQQQQLDADAELRQPALSLQEYVQQQQQQQQQLAAQQAAPVAAAAAKSLEAMSAFLGSGGSSSSGGVVEQVEAAATAPAPAAPVAVVEGSVRTIEGQAPDSSTLPNQQQQQQQQQRQQLTDLQSKLAQVKQQQHQPSGVGAESAAEPAAATATATAASAQKPAFSLKELTNMLRSQRSAAPPHGRKAPSAAAAADAASQLNQSQSGFRMREQLQAAAAGVSKDGVTQNLEARMQQAQQQLKEASPAFQYQLQQQLAQLQQELAQQQQQQQDASAAVQLQQSDASAAFQQQQQQVLQLQQLMQQLQKQSVAARTAAEQQQQQQQQGPRAGLKALLQQAIAEPTTTTTSSSSSSSSTTAAAAAEGQASVFDILSGKWAPPAAPPKRKQTIWDLPQQQQQQQHWDLDAIVPELGRKPQVDAWKPARANTYAPPRQLMQGEVEALTEAKAQETLKRQQQQQQQQEQMLLLQRAELQRQQQEEQRLEAETARLAAETEARMQQLLSGLGEETEYEVAGGSSSSSSTKGGKKGKAEAQRKAAEAKEAAKRRKDKERERLAAAAAAAERKAEKKAAKKEAAVAAGSAASSRWASKLQQLQQQQTPAEAAIAAADDVTAAAAESASDDELEAFDLHSSSSSSKAPRQLREVQMPALCSVRQLASLLGVQVSQLEEVFEEQLGEEVKSEEDLVPPESAELAALEFGVVLLRPPEDVAAEPRPPIVTVMGHVDHGKTSLLDALRSSNVTAGEAGGITQHIGAFEVKMPGSGNTLTFLDTPGHAAFGAMRARGAAATDIVVLAVAADDGVMPQTREALAHARAAQCPIVVALTKCDLPQAHPDEVKMQLLAEGLELEEFGGDVQCVQTAARAGLGLRDLEEALLLQAEVMELKAPRDVAASGVVVEAQLSKGLGAVATVILKRGVLKPGDPLVVGTEHGRVRVLRSGSGKTLVEAGPGQAVVVSGLKGLPAAGDELIVVEDEGRASRMAAARASRAEEFRRSQLTRMQAEARRQQQALREQEYERKRKLKQRIQEIKAAGVKSREAADLKTLHAQAHLQEQQQLKAAAAGGSSGASLAAAAAADVSSAAAEGQEGGDLSPEATAAGADADVDTDAAPVLPPDAPTVTFIIKGDVQGSVEAVTEAITAAAAGRAAVRFVYSGVGPISTSDVHLAATTGARLIAFNVAAPSGDVDTALRSSRVEVMRHNVIYHLLDEVTAVLTAAEVGGATGPAGVSEEVVGSALVLAVFPMIKNRVEVGKVAGCRVQEGSLGSGPGVVYRVLREGQVVFEGPLSSLKQQRNTVAAVGKGNECGVALQDGEFADYQPGDVVQCVQRRTTGS